MKRYFLGLTSFLLTACTTVSYDLHPQSHFDYPNSNVKPMGQVTGEASHITFMVPAQVSGEIERQAINAALRTKPGADMLVNYISETKITTLPLINILNYKVSGTAASMSVGLQDLK